MDILEDASSSTDQASLDPIDEIASLLDGDEEDETSDVDNTDDVESEEEAGDEEDAEEQTDESTDEVNESDDDISWESTLGVDEGQLHYDEEGNLAGINVKVNDKSDTVGMKDLILGYQTNKANTQKSQALSDERKTFTEQLEVVQKDYSTKLENVELLTTYLGDKLVQEFQGIDWDQLRVENPAEYAAARQDYSAKAQELKQAQDAIAEEKQQQVNSNNANNQKKQQAYMKEQRDLTIANNPSWSNKETLQKDLSALQSFADNQYGFTGDEFNKISDARIIELVKDAKSFREGVKVAALKRKKPVPKFQKSGGGKRKSTTKLDKLTKKARTATGAHKRAAQTDAIAELIGG